MGLTVLDAGVVIAGLDADDARHRPATRAIRAAWVRHDSLAVPASACAEILVRPASRGAATVARVDAALDAMAIVRRAAVLRARRASLRVPDALVFAAAVELDTDHLVTTDRRWNRLPGIGLGAHLTVIA